MSSSVTVTTSSTSSRMISKEVARTGDGDAVGDRRARRHLERVPRGERRRVRRGVLGLHADDAHGAAARRPRALDRARDAGDQAAAADAGRTIVSRSGHLLEQLEAERALAGDDVAVVERVDEHRAGALGELRGEAQRRLDGRALEHHLGAVAAGRQRAWARARRAA